MLKQKPIAESSKISIKEIILSKVMAIAKELPTHQDSIGLHSGEAGSTVFYSYLSDYLGTSKYNDKIEKSLLKIFEEINNGSVNTTFCSGLAGVVWAINHLKKKELLELEDSFEDIYKALKESALNYARHGDFDFLHGADGIVYSLLVMNVSDEEFINNWLELLHKDAKKEKNGYVWETILTMDSNKRIFNLSLSHGISSKIIVLAEVLKRYPANILAKQLLDGSVTYLMHSKSPGKSNCFFLSYVDEENIVKQGRLGWCYGDLGNAIALWRAGCIIDNNVWKKQAIDVMLLATARRDLKLESVLDAGFCHGSAGIAHIFNRFYMETGRTEFNEARWYWIEKTLEFGNEKDGIAGFKKYLTIEKKYVSEPGFLEGTTGVAMVLLGFLSKRKESIAWDACFLMN